MKVVLKKSVQFEGKEIKEIDLNLEDLTGEDLAQAEREYFASGGHPVIPLLISSAYCAILAARAANLPQEAIQGLPIKDCHRIISETQSFLVDSES